MHRFHAFLAGAVSLAVWNGSINEASACPADIIPNGVVNVDDLLLVIGSWGLCPGCPAEITGDGFVNADDLIGVLIGWGPCPTGACCFPDGTCAVLTELACASGGGAYSGDLLGCGAVVCPVLPPNDLCAAAIEAPEGVIIWDNTAAGFDGPPLPPECGGFGTRDVWFTYTATCRGHLTIDTFGTAPPFVDTIVQVFGGTCAALGPILACNDDFAFPGVLLSSVTLDVVMGQELIIRCMSWGAAPANEGLAMMTIDCEPYANDFCFDPIPIAVGGEVFDTLEGATPDFEPACFGIPTGLGRWYRVIGTGAVLIASTCESPVEFWNAMLTVYDGPDCAALECVAAADVDSCPFFHEAVAWCSEPGAPYWILVHTDFPPPPGMGNYKLKVTAGPPCPPP